MSPLLRAGVLGLVVVALGGVLALKRSRSESASDPGPTIAEATQETGLQEADLQETGLQETGPQDIGPQETGPQAAEPRAGLPRLVDLGAGACIPCKKMKPILDELRVTYAARFEVVFIDVWKHPEAAEPYEIRLIPTQIFYAPDGEELFRHEGFFSREDILAKWDELGFRWDEPAGHG